MTASTDNWKRRPSVGRIALLLAASGLLLAALFAIAVSQFPMRGGGLFGALAKAIKGNPGRTTVIAFTALACLWLGVGLVTAIQEWRSPKR